MAGWEKLPCPWCAAAPGALTVTISLHCDPPGTASVAGVQPKLTARHRPELSCNSCPNTQLGELEGDKIVFDPPPNTR